MSSQWLNPTIALVTLGLSLAAPSLVHAAPPPSEANLDQEVRVLRGQGAEGLTLFLHRYAEQLNPSNPRQPATSTALVRAALDQLCQQRDCYASQLYWYTDLDQAKAAAQATGKPILSLRLLGELDQDLSCANSRFFRVALYPNAQISQMLRDRFILHWQSVRPVPTVTVDFGDGRTLVRTITGNSIHYVLAADGRPLEAIPGLYGPKAFLQQLRRAEQLAQDYARQPLPERNALVQQYHRDRLEAIQAQWRSELAAVGIQPLPDLAALPATLDQAPTAGDASQLAMSKLVIELPLLRSFGLLAYQNQQALAAATDETTWQALATRQQSLARLDQASLDLIQAKRRHHPQAVPLSALIQSFEATMAIDTVRNEYLLHSQLHQWFADAPTPQDVATLNDRVYAQLFLTPNSDPWLGLYGDDQFTAIDNDGIRQ